MILEDVAIAALTPFDRNPRSHPDGHVDNLAASLGEFSFLLPVVIAADDIILGGHGLIEAAKKRGQKSVPAHRVNVLGDSPEAAKIVLALNRLGQANPDDDRFATDDEDITRLLLEEIAEAIGLAGSGFDEADLGALQADVIAFDPEDRAQHEDKASLAHKWLVAFVVSEEEKRALDDLCDAEFSAKEHPSKTVARLFCERVLGLVPEVVP